MTTILADGGQTIYIEDIGGIINYSIDSGSPTPLSWPTDIGNSNTSLGFLKVIFKNDITFTGNLNVYFNCLNDNIQFGDTSLRPNGERAKITIHDTPNYQGLVRNGDILDIGKSNIYIFNIAVLATGTTTLTNGEGWIARQYFARKAQNNVIVNCFSDGAIPEEGGGIVGKYAGYSTEGIVSSISIIGCSSSGSIGIKGGGIAGSFFCFADSPDYSVSLIQECFSTGAISEFAGGIVGLGCGLAWYDQTVPSVSILKCYSIGPIGANFFEGIYYAGGGIVGDNGLGIIVDSSYSIGDICGGGIYGSNAGNVSTYATTINCFTIGAIEPTELTPGGGIYGYNSLGNDNISAKNCYTSGLCSTSSNGIYSGSNDDNAKGSDNYSEANPPHSNLGEWSSTNANNNVLIGVPTPSIPVGVTWALDPENLVNGPYILSSFGYIPYSVANIDMTNPSAPTLVKTYSQTIPAGGSTISAVITTGHTFYILAIEGAAPISYPTITINASTGAITAAAGTAIGIYNIVVYDKINPYTTTQFVLTLIEPPAPASDVCCVSSSTYKGLSAEDIASYRVGSLLLTERATNPRMKFPSYEEYMKYKKAAAGAKKR